MGIFVAGGYTGVVIAHAVRCVFVAERDGHLFRSADFTMFFSSLFSFLFGGGGGMRFIGARSPQGSFLPLPQLPQLFPAHYPNNLSAVRPSISSESLRCQQQEPSILLLLCILSSMGFARCVCWGGGALKRHRANYTASFTRWGVLLCPYRPYCRGRKKYDTRKKHEHTVSRCGQAYILDKRWLVARVNNG